MFMAQYKCQVIIIINIAESYPTVREVRFQVKQLQTLVFVYVRFADVKGGNFI